MAWIETTFAYGSILTSTKMTNLFNNFSGLANQDSGAPKLWNSYRNMLGFDMDGVSDVNSPILVHAMKVGPGRCLEAGGEVAIVFDSTHTKEISSGANYSFGNSGGAVPSSLSVNWPVYGNQLSYKWFHKILMKNTVSGSMDWGLDTDPYSASNLLVEVNSVNGGGWDQFRRLSSVLVFGPNRIADFYKRGNLSQRNLAPTLSASITNNTSYFPFYNLGPTGTDCLVGFTFTSVDRAAGDHIYFTPTMIHSYNQKYGLSGVNIGFRHYGQNASMIVNSGNVSTRVASTVLTGNFILNWWIDPFVQ